MDREDLRRILRHRREHDKLMAKAKRVAVRNAKKRGDNSGFLHPDDYPKGMLERLLKMAARNLKEGEEQRKNARKYPPGFWDQMVGCVA